MNWIFKTRRMLRLVFALVVFGLLLNRARAQEDANKPDDAKDAVDGEKSGGIREKIREHMRGNSGAARATQPTQPASGPGGSDYSHGSFTRSTFGEGNDEFIIFEPADPKPEKAPVILFLHGWTAMKPEPYLDWITHLARRGNIVIYPRYQAKITTKPAEFTPSAIKAVKAALAVLEGSDHVHPDREKVAAVGHSMGGILTANLAAAVSEGLPPIKAAMCVEPGNGGYPINADYSKIPAGTLLLTISGDADKLAKDTNAKAIFSGATSIAKGDKNYIIAASDDHGTPNVTANHMAPTTASGNQNALHYYGYWKWFDGLTDAAFFGKNRDYALGNTANQRYMGLWSDGVPVAEPKIQE